MKIVSELESAVDAKDNPYLQGMFTPQTREVEVAGLQVIGEVPKDLTGIYLRNGPNPRHSARGVHHWFDGDGMMHGAEFHKGEVTYRNRWVQTTGLQVEDKAGHAVWPGLIDSPDRSLTEAWGSDHWLKDSSNTDVVYHNGMAVSTFYQCGEAYLLNPVTLQTNGKIDLGGMGVRSMSAHPMVDETTGEMMFFDYGAKSPYMTYGVINATGKLVHHTPIDLPGPRLPHTLAITENYTLLMDLPLFWNENLLQRDVHKVEYYPELPSRFGVIGRHGAGDSIRWFEAEPTYIYHVINAWEDGDKIVMDACRMRTPAPTQEARQRYRGPYGTLQAWLKLDATYHRWHFDLRTGETREEPLNDLISEFPMINSRYSGRPSRYSYHMSFADSDQLLFDGLIKYDSESGKVQQHKFGGGCYGSESPFAPRIGSSEEDDGYVVSFVSNVPEQRSELQVFDAKDFSVGPVARVLLPQFVPGGFHSCWVPHNLMR
ncbi:MAG: carotenoid oxygenase family protein [Pseudomonadales bacterium]